MYKETTYLSKLILIYSINCDKEEIYLYFIFLLNKPLELENYNI